VRLARLILSGHVEGERLHSELTPQQPSPPEQTQPQKEGVVDILTRLMNERAMDRALDHALNDLGRQWRERTYKDFPSREEEARLLAEERKYFEQLTPEEQHQYSIEKTIRNLKNIRTMSDQVEYLQSRFRFPHHVTELQQRDPKFMDPLISALRQRPDWQKKEKAIERLERLQRRRTKDHPQGSEGQS
jgi:hypothetical protein